MEKVIGTTDELPEGERKIIEIEGKEIAVFNIDGEYHACVNWCPHQGGPICEGKLTGTTDAEFDRESLDYSLEWIKDGQIVMCPWHAWEFDVTNGESGHDKDVSLITYPVTVENDSIIVNL